MRADEQFLKLELKNLKKFEQSLEHFLHQQFIHCKAALLIAKHSLVTQ